MIRTSFRDCTTEDIRKFIVLIENEMNYKASTIEKYKKILKFFYRVVYGKNESYLEQVKWFSIKVSKDKIRESFVLDNAEYLVYLMCWTMKRIVMDDVVKMRRVRYGTVVGWLEDNTSIIGEKYYD
jgi:hypothetical protein